jgi:hypothetical protein
MQVAPFSIRFADGLAQPQHRPLAKSNESARRVAAQMRQVLCKFKYLANSSALQIQVPSNSRALQIVISLRASSDVAKHPRCVYIRGIVARTEEGFA